MTEFLRPRLAQAANWHFLRYFDDAGFHIRVRMHLDADAADAAVDDFDRIKAHLSLTPTRGWKSLRGREVFPHLGIVRRETTAAEWAVYAPERSKWGTGASLETAHALFTESSSCASTVIEDVPSPSARAFCGLYLLHRVSERIPVSEDQRVAFLDRHASWWSLHQEQLRPGQIDSDSAAATRLQRSVERPAHPTHQTEALDSLAQSIVLSALQTTETRNPLYFIHQHLHLTLNRLGIHGDDESWLAEQAMDPKMRSYLTRLPPARNE